MWGGGSWSRSRKNIYFFGWEKEERKEKKVKGSVSDGQWCHRQKSRTFQNQLEKTNDVCPPLHQPRVDMIFCLHWIELIALYPLVGFFPLCLAAIVFNQPNESRDVTMTNSLIGFFVAVIQNHLLPKNFFFFWVSGTMRVTLIPCFGILECGVWAPSQSTFVLSSFLSFSLPSAPLFSRSSFPSIAPDFSRMASVIGKKKNAGEKWWGTRILVSFPSKINTPLPRLSARPILIVMIWDQEILL